MKSNLLLCIVLSVFTDNYITSAKSFLHEFDSMHISSSILLDDDDYFTKNSKLPLNFNIQEDGTEFNDSIDMPSASSPFNKEQLSSYSQTPMVSKGTNTLALDLSHATQKHLLKTGTTIVGMCCPQGVVLAADTRSTGGPLVMDKAKLKIHQVSKLIYCCAAGTSADCDQLTREARHALQLLRLEIAPHVSRPVLGSNTCVENKPAYFDPVSAALLCISRSQLKKRGRSGDSKSSVLIMGGFDNTGSSLHSIDADGVFTGVSFSALGSGSTDAIAVLEDYLHHHNRQYSITHDSTSTTSNSDINKGSSHAEELVRTCCDVSIEEAVKVVRRAVLAGITNDLGSGSFVDFCVIERGGVKKWREDGPCCTPLSTSSDPMFSSTTVHRLVPAASDQVTIDQEASVSDPIPCLLYETRVGDVSASLTLKLDASFI